MGNNKDYYVTLTGSKSNCGDFLINYRAKAILSALRPDREIKNFDAWNKLSDEDLEIVNQSKGLILLGGPSLQKSIYPNIYPLRDNLDDIKTPIVTMGVGWKSLNGDWKDARDYTFSKKSLNLLDKIEETGCSSSVRDYHTLNALLNKGYKSFVMTGCPALYTNRVTGNRPRKIKSVAFSLGVAFISSNSMRVQMQTLISSLADRFGKENFTVAFHHSLSDDFLNTHNSTHKHLGEHRKFAEWLTKHGYKYHDISGSAENMINFYDRFDLHIGYRVHAHILMSSLSKPSMLLSEDGRGKALRKVIGGCIYDAFDGVSDSLVAKLCRRIGVFDTFDVYDFLGDELMGLLDYELKNDWPSIACVDSQIDEHRLIMTNFVKKLP